METAVLPGQLNTDCSIRVHNYADRYYQNDESQLSLIQFATGLAGLFIPICLESFAKLGNHLQACRRSYMETKFVSYQVWFKQMVQGVGGSGGLVGYGRQVWPSFRGKSGVLIDGTHICLDRNIQGAAEADNAAKSAIPIV